MDTSDGSEECRQVAEMTLGYIEALIEGARTHAARELLMDWAHLVKMSQQKTGDE